MNPQTCRECRGAGVIGQTYCRLCGKDVPAWDSSVLDKTAFVIETDCGHRPESNTFFKPCPECRGSGVLKLDES